MPCSKQLYYRFRFVSLVLQYQEDNQTTLRGAFRAVAADRDGPFGGVRAFEQFVHRHRETISSLHADSGTIPTFFDDGQPTYKRTSPNSAHRKALRDHERDADRDERQRFVRETMRAIKGDKSGVTLRRIIESYYELTSGRVRHDG